MPEPLGFSERSEEPYRSVHLDAESRLWQRFACSDHEEDMSDKPGHIPDRQAGLADQGYAPISAGLPSRTDHLFGLPIDEKMAMIKPIGYL